jgi:hypothetical protein
MVRAITAICQVGTACKSKLVQVCIKLYKSITCLLGFNRGTGGPGSVHGSPNTDSVTNIVGTVGERSSAGSNDLDEGVKVFDLVGVAWSMSVDTSHALSFWSTENTKLSLVDVVVETVEEANNDTSGDTLQDCLHVVDLVDGTSTHLVLVESTHSPTDRTAFLTEISVVLVTSLLEHASVCHSGVLVVDTVSALGHDFGR